MGNSIAQTSVDTCQGCHKKYHRPDGLDNRNLFLHSLGGWKSEIKVLEGLAFVPFPCVFTSVFPLCVCVSVSCSYKDTSHIGLEPPAKTSFNLNYILKDLISKYSHILKDWGLGLHHINFGRT